jgi:transposase
MPWTKITRVKYQRKGLRYASDLTDAEWALIARKLPPRCRLGRPREVDLREVVQAIFYVLSTGCQWRALPREFPPYSTVQGYFYGWRDSGRWQRIVQALVRQARRRLGRKPRPTAAVIDSQTASTTEAGGPCGFDPGKHLHGRKRHIVTDTNGLCWLHTFIPPMFRMSMAPSLCWRACTSAFPDCDTSLPTGFIGANSLSTHSPIAAPGRSRSSSDRPGSKASSSCPDVGSSSVRLHGSVDADALPKTSKAPQLLNWPGFSSPISGS